MKYRFSVSPGVISPVQLASWYVFNTWLQKISGETLQFENFESFEAQQEKIQNDEIDLIYVNPYDAAILVRDKGFLPVCKPSNHSDEVAIVVNEAHNASNIEALQPGLRLATVNDPDVHLIGMMLLEPADLDSQNIEVHQKPNYVAVAKALIRGEADVGMFSCDAFDDLSKLIKGELRTLVRSQIQVIHHSLLVSPRLAHQRDRFIEALSQGHEDSKTAEVFSAIGIDAWSTLQDEEIEFMLDLMDTLG